MAVEKIENNELIANRVPPGDKWELVIDKEIIKCIIYLYISYILNPDYRLIIRIVT